MIANYLHARNIQYVYERPLVGSIVEGKFRPDFTFVTDSGDPLLWEHLGLLDQPGFRKAWESKREWYRQNGFIEGSNLFTTTEGPGLDMKAVQVAADAIASHL